MVAFKQTMMTEVNAAWLTFVPTFFSGFKFMFQINLADTLLQATVL